MVKDFVDSQDSVKPREEYTKFYKSPSKDILPTGRWPVSISVYMETGTTVDHEFETIDMDGYGRKYIEHPGAAPEYDLAAVLEKLREGLRQQFPLARDIFRKCDFDHDGVMNRDKFRQALEKWGFQLFEEAVLVIMRNFDLRKDGQVSYNEFCDALLDEDYITSSCQGGIYRGGPRRDGSAAAEHQDGCQHAAVRELLKCMDLDGFDRVPSRQIVDTVPTDQNLYGRHLNAICPACGAAISCVNQRVHVSHACVHICAGACVHAVSALSQ